MSELNVAKVRVGITTGRTVSSDGRGSPAKELELRADVRVPFMGIFLNGSVDSKSPQDADQAIESSVLRTNLVV